jgi:hypothetical protein
MMPEEAILELLADWFAAEVAYDGKWPTGRWIWVEKNWHGMTSTMHKVDVQFLAALLCVMGFEQSVMVGMAGNENKKFEWSKGIDIVGAESAALKARFYVLWSYNDKLFKKGR